MSNQTRVSSTVAWADFVKRASGLGNYATDLAAATTYDALGNPAEVDGKAAQAWLAKAEKAEEQRWADRRAHKAYLKARPAKRHEFAESKAVKARKEAFKRSASIAAELNRGADNNAVGQFDFNPAHPDPQVRSAGSNAYRAAWREYEEKHPALELADWIDQGRPS